MCLYTCWHRDNDENTINRGFQIVYLKKWTLLKEYKFTFDSPGCQVFVKVHVTKQITIFLLSTYDLLTVAYLMTKQLFSQFIVQNACPTVC